jgi:hypothetical protein
VVKHKEIRRRDIFTKNIMKKAQNDIDFIPSIMNHTISDAQKYSSLSSAVIKSHHSLLFKTFFITFQAFGIANPADTCFGELLPGGRYTTPLIE